MPLQSPIDSILQSETESSTEQPAGLLTLQQIADTLDEKYHRLRPFADIAGIGPYVGAVVVRGVKGVRYEPRAVEQFRRLLQAKDDKQITVSTALHYLANIEGSSVEIKSQSYNTDGNAELMQFSKQLYQSVTALLDRIDKVIESTVIGSTSPLDDRLIGREEAAELLHCKMGRVSSYVKPVRRSTWRHSDILKYIVGL